MSEDISEIDNYAKERKELWLRFYGHWFYW